ncbi:hypothetical protein VAMP_54n185 [Candidatus Vampirococcus lugosii]|uniref:Uncharacterized protein n=1 Tax=Candidatus Vampirococcus lugosii TaxID=2789015 RepID=A0ABS5QLB4_9BACT|nr:hypothetical protein [Candidatus Vampirococcus lugosii]
MFTNYLVKFFIDKDTKKYINEIILISINRIFKILSKIYGNKLIE